MSIRFGELQDRIYDAFNKCEEYIVRTPEARLNEDAPPEAVEAYHEFLRLSEEQEREDEKWPGEII